MVAIAAMSPDRVIGANGKIPWHLPADLQFFKRTTWGHVVVMGRKTYESLGKPLPGRENWVVSRTASFDGLRVFRDVAEIPSLGDGRKVFVIGGAELYAALLPRCDEVILTHVERRVEGDTWFPEFEADFLPGTHMELGEGFAIKKYLRRGVN